MKKYLVLIVCLIMFFSGTIRAKGSENRANSETNLVMNTPNPLTKFSLYSVNESACIDHQKSDEINLYPEIQFNFITENIGEVIAYKEINPGQLIKTDFILLKHSKYAHAMLSKDYAYKLPDDFIFYPFSKAIFKYSNYRKITYCLNLNTLPVKSKSHNKFVKTDFVLFFDA